MARVEKNQKRRIESIESVPKAGEVSAARSKGKQFGFNIASLVFPRDPVIAFPESLSNTRMIRESDRKHFEEMAEKISKHVAERTGIKFGCESSMLRIDSKGRLVFLDVGIIDLKKLVGFLQQSNRSPSSKKAILALLGKSKVSK